MGLDMYLYAKPATTADQKRLWKQRIPVNIPRSEVAYWRKANAIHNWFVNNVQDGVDECQESPVSREKLAELRDIAKRVLEDPENLGPQLLPTTAGFFFGSTDYSGYYVECLEYTVKKIDEAVQSVPDDRDFYYQSSW